MQIYHLASCLTIRHSVDGTAEKAHYHTVEIEIYVRIRDSFFHTFSSIEETVNQHTARYANQYLNEFTEFSGDASIENIGEVLFWQLSDALETKGMVLDRLAIGETPLRVYAIQREN